MERYALTLFCLVGLLATTTLGALERTYYQKVGDDLEFPVDKDYDPNYDDVTSCELKLNDGRKISLYPNNEDDTRRFSVTYYKCNTNIRRLTLNDTGKWEIIATIKKSNGKIDIKHNYYNLQVRQNVHGNLPILPTSKTSAYPDQQISAHFNEKFDNLKSCKLLTPERREYDLSSDTSANIKLLGHCGFKMTVKKEYQGIWILVADLKNSTAYSSNFNVKVNDAKTLHPKDNYINCKKGETVTIATDRRGSMCILEDPHGVRLPISTGYCSHEIHAVTEHHEGVWKAYYGLEGIQTLVEQKIIIQTFDPSPLNSSITRSANGDINLLCRVRSSSTHFCSFIKPDGDILHMTIGVGDSKYEYYGDGEQNHESLGLGRKHEYDCGVTIHNPSVEDYGPWRCLIRVESSEYKTLGRVLKVTPHTRNAADENSITEVNDVYVKRGESYKMKCLADEMLSYCWFRSPNGTSYYVHVDKEAILPNLKYAGESLELGDCTAEIPEATPSDIGEWSCHMGIVNGPEIEASFKVVLKETHLMASEDVIVLDSSTNSDLICRPLPESNKVIEACRWVNPLGHGINVDPQGRYYTETSSTHCKLSIREVNFDSDMGEWSCYARFVETKEEGHDSMTVTRTNFSIGTFLGIGVVISLLVVSTVGIFGLILYKRRTVGRRLDEKIILDEKPEHYP